MISRSYKIMPGFEVSENLGIIDKGMSSNGDFMPHQEKHEELEGKWCVINSPNGNPVTHEI
jgi:hypothetical protein